MVDDMIDDVQTFVDAAQILKVNEDINKTRLKGLSWVT